MDRPDKSDPDNKLRVAGASWLGVGFALTWAAWRDNGWRLREVDVNQWRLINVLTDERGFDF